MNLQKRKVLMNDFFNAQFNYCKSIQFDQPDQIINNVDITLSNLFLQRMSYCTNNTAL